MIQAEAPVVNVKIVKKQVETYIVHPTRMQLDPMRIAIEPFEGDGYRGGKVTITCWDTTGSYFWNGCGCSLKEFLTTINFGYWVEKLFPKLVNSQYLPEKTKKNFLDEIIKCRKDHELDKEQSRELYDCIKEDMPEEEQEHWTVSWVWNELRNVAARVKAEWLYDDPGAMGSMMEKTYDSHLLHMWFKGWVPFVQELCRELGIEYEERWAPECADFYKFAEPKGEPSQWIKDAIGKEA